MNSPPFFQTLDLFERDQGGYTLYRIPGLCITPGGAVFAHTEARFGKGGDWDAIDIVTRRSDDNGQSWGTPRKLLDHGDFGHGPLHNFNTIVDGETGTIHALFCFNYARAFAMQSTDDGESFSDPVEITATFEAFRSEVDWGVIAIGLPNGIQLRSGRLIIPVWLSTSKTTAHRPNRCAVIYSDDHGRSWQRGELVPDVVPNLNEAAIVELDDGRVLLNMRNGGGVKRRVITTSPTGIERWQTPWLDPALLEPTCQATLVRFSIGTEDRSRILFCNPDSQQGKDAKGSAIFLTRSNLTVKLSYDGCRTWPIAKVIEPGLSGYSALAVCRDKAVLALYERGKPHGNDTDDYLTLARFNLAWLSDGRDDVVL